MGWGGGIAVLAFLAGSAEGAEISLAGRGCFNGGDFLAGAAAAFVFRWPGFTIGCLVLELVAEAFATFFLGTAGALCFRPADFAVATGRLAVFFGAAFLAGLRLATCPATGFLPATAFTAGFLGGDCFAPAFFFAAPVPALASLRVSAGFFLALLPLPAWLAFFTGRLPGRVFNFAMGGILGIWVRGKISRSICRARISRFSGQLKDTIFAPRNGAVAQLVRARDS